MKHCPTCNRTYPDTKESFCTEDGTRLVSQASVSPNLQPTLYALPLTQAAVNPQSYVTPNAQVAAANPQPVRRTKGLAAIAMVCGSLSAVFLVYIATRIAGPGWFAFTHWRIPHLISSAWGVEFILGILLMLVSLLLGAIALMQSIKKPLRYGGKGLAIAGPVMSVMLAGLVIGLFTFRRLQAPSSYSSNDSSRYSSTTSTSPSNAASMSEEDKYRLFYAATKTGDKTLQSRAAKKIGIIDADGNPTSSYQSFVKGAMSWAMNDVSFIKSVDTPDKARAYVLERLDTE